MKELRPEIVDITGEPRAECRGAAFCAVRELRLGESVVLLTAEEPSLLMRSLGLLAGHKLAWSIAGEGGR